MQSEGFVISQRWHYLLTEKSDRAQHVLDRQVGEIELAKEDIEQTSLGGRTQFFGDRLRRADEDEIVAAQIIRVEQVGHDLGRPGLAAADELLCMRAHAVLERFAGLRRREKALIGTRGPREGDVDRLAVALVDIDQRAIGDLRLARPVGLRPLLEEYAITRRGIGARIDQKVNRGNAPLV